MGRKGVTALVYEHMMENIGKRSKIFEKCIETDKNCIKIFKSCIETFEKNGKFWTPPGHKGTKKN